MITGISGNQKVDSEILILIAQQFGVNDGFPESLMAALLGLRL